MILQSNQTQPRCLASLYLWVLYSSRTVQPAFGSHPRTWVESSPLRAFWPVCSLSTLLESYSADTHTRCFKHKASVSGCHRVALQWYCTWLIGSWCRWKACEVSRPSSLQFLDLPESGLFASLALNVNASELLEYFKIWIIKIEFESY